jgi:hypothetical protein
MDTVMLGGYRKKRAVTEMMFGDTEMLFHCTVLQKGYTVRKNITVFSSEIYRNV